MVQFQSLDSGFSALADATRRRVLERLAQADASITALADGFQMSLTGMKKHVSVLERAGLVTTEKRGRVRTCTLGRSVDRELAWMEEQRQRWASRFDALDQIVGELSMKEKNDAPE